MADVLLLNADAQPVSYFPLSTIQWEDAISYIHLGKVNVVEWYDDWEVSSPTWKTKVPAVIMLKDYVKQKTHVRFSKNNVYLRDQFTCQYCGCKLTKRTATLDHVIPQCMGGKTTFENSVAACGPCNGKKANKTIMKPKNKPHKPGYWELVRKRRLLPFDIRHPSWYHWIDLEYDNMPAKC